MDEEFTFRKPSEMKRLTEVQQDAPGAPPAEWGWVPVLALPFMLLFMVVLLRTAWLCDDAYITFRTVDNFIDGYGLRWNVAERVQTFTHPLWLFVLSAAYAFTGELYYTPLFLSMIL